MSISIGAIVNLPPSPSFPLPSTPLVTFSYCFTYFLSSWRMNRSFVFSLSPSYSYLLGINELNMDIRAFLGYLSPYLRCLISSSSPSAKRKRDIGREYKNKQAEKIKLNHRNPPDEKIIDRIRAVARRLINLLPALNGKPGRIDDLFFTLFTFKIQT